MEKGEVVNGLGTKDFVVKGCVPKTRCMKIALSLVALAVKMILVSCS